MSLVPMPRWVPGPPALGRFWGGNVGLGTWLLPLATWPVTSMGWRGH